MHKQVYGGHGPLERHGLGHVHGLRHDGHIGMDL
jgi:hypothetical protein